MSKLITEYENILKDKSPHELEAITNAANSLITSVIKCDKSKVTAKDISDLGKGLKSTSEKSHALPAKKKEEQHHH